MRETYFGLGATPSPFPIPPWLQTMINKVSNEAEAHVVKFAWAVERYRQLAQAAVKQNPTQANIDWAKLMETYGSMSTHPDDPFWKQTDRKKHHDTFVDFGERNFAQFTSFAHTDWNPLHAIAKIPVLGPVFKAATTPFTMIANLAQGERIDHALLGAMKEQLGGIKSLAPYAATIVSFVPGIGTGVAAAIAAGAALAEGKPIDQALEEGIKGAIPGGALAAAGFDLAKKVASGANVAKAALETARATLPPEAQKAFDIGLAVTSGKSLQNSLMSAVTSLAPAETKQLLDVGAQAVQTVPGLADLAKSLPSDVARQGAQMAAGALAHQGVNEAQIRALRTKLTGEALNGFDAVTQAQSQHFPWLAGVSDPLAGVTQAVATHAAAPPTPKPHELPKAPAPTPKPHEPPAPHRVPAATPKPHEPPAPTRALATTAAPTSAVPAPATTTTPVATPSQVTDRPYPPYPPMSGAVHGLGYAPYPHALGEPSSTEVRSPTSTSTEVRSPTSTSTEVRSPTSTSTEAYTQGNFTATVTGGAGAGANTTVHIHAPPLNRANTSQSKGPRINAQENTAVHAPRSGVAPAQENKNVNAPRGALGYAPYPSFLGVPPPHPHPHVAHGYHPTHHGGRATYAPATVVIETPAGGTCRQWSEPIEMDQAMIWAARSAVNGSRGSPRMVQGPDGTNYLFAIENGVLTARACIS